MLSDLQRRKLTHLFKLYDLNQNGYIEQSDYAGYAKNIATAYKVEANPHAYGALQAIYDTRWKQLKQAADLEQENRISLDRWLAHYEKLLSDEQGVRTAAAQAVDAFLQTYELLEPGIMPNSADWNRFRQFHAAYNIDEGVTTDAFRRLDKNRSNSLTRNEIFQAMLDFFGDDENATGNWFFGAY